MSTVSTAEPTEAASTSAAPGEVRQGVLAMLPMVVGYAPFGIVVGSVIAHQSRAAGWVGTWFIFSGSAQLATLRGVADGALVLAIVTGLVINARLLVYSASLAGHWRDQPRWFRLVAAAALVDPTWLLAEQRAERPGTPRDHRRFFLGVTATLAVTWGVMVTAGMLLGAQLNGKIGLDVAVPLCLLALVGPRLLEPRSRIVVLAAGATAAVTTSLPAGSGLLLAIVVGLAAGHLVPGRQP